MISQVKFFAIKFLSFEKYPHNFKIYGKGYHSANVDNHFGLFATHSFTNTTFRKKIAKNPGQNQENCETLAQHLSKAELRKDLKIVEQNPIPESQGGEKTADIGVFDEKRVIVRAKRSKIPRRNQENGGTIAQQESKVELRKNLKIVGQNSMPENEGIASPEKSDNILAIDEKRVTVRARRRKNQAGQNQENDGTFAQQESKSDDIG